ncbi:stress responsive alpha/beta barrel protein [Salsuginibacillus halophilus]|uniref:Stress responsive alpha/beta barrel protein n=1 Tax=Salsuginibacillus halophilus TaxID=517424 RepID=A0A2P8HDU7_9BACI|nr:Dabb family protein [Salsuginibacillus halophilus]PSL44398.1 stress responsive alpha/beta barrel protein [Salsuginibacillus halophilus]
MIEHIVIMKFNEATTLEQMQEGARRLEQLKDEIPGILEMKAGINFSERSQGFEFALTSRFESKEALEAYGPHPKHEEVVEYLNSIGLSDKLAVDFEHIDPVV